VLTAVRAFYLDIAEWADDDPARWGPRAVRCQVTASKASHNPTCDTLVRAWKVAADHRPAPASGLGTLHTR
jgi:hypothetical protein